MKSWSQEFWNYIMFVDSILWGLISYMILPLDYLPLILFLFFLTGHYNKLRHRVLLDNIHIVLLILVNLSISTSYWYFIYFIWMLLFSITNSTVLKIRWLRTYSIIMFVLVSIYSCIVFYPDKILFIVTMFSSLPVILGVLLLENIMMSHQLSAEKEKRCLEILIEATVNLISCDMLTTLEDMFTSMKVSCFYGETVTILREKEDLYYKLSLITTLCQISKIVVEDDYIYFTGKYKEEYKEVLENIGLHQFKLNIKRYIRK